VAIGEKAKKKAIDQIFLSDNDVTDLFAQRCDPAAKFLHLLRDFLS
jgi:hypothetical protein